MNSNQVNYRYDDDENECQVNLTSSPLSSVSNFRDEQEVVSEESSKSFSQRNDANTYHGTSQVNKQSDESDGHGDRHTQDHSDCCSLPEHEELTPKSKNINRILLYSFFAFASRSLWNQSVLSAFVYLLKSDNPEFVGILTGLMGVCQLITSFPAGILGDKFRRDTMLKIGCVVGVLASFLTIAASQAKDFVFLGVALSFWGLYWGITNPSISALFADSMNDGERSTYFTTRMIIQYMGNATGPLLAFFMFSFLGNDWTIEECQVVLCVAQVLAFPALITLCSLSDDYIVTSNSASYDSDTDIDNSSDEEESDHRSNDDDERSLSANDLETPLLANSYDDDDEFIVKLPSEKRSKYVSTKTCCCFKMSESRLVPVLVASADLFGGLAAGMSIRYFPVFFLDNLNLTPRFVQLMFFCSTFGMAISGKITQKLGSKFGRLETAIFVKCLGASLFIAMVACYQSNTPLSLICILWVLRTTLSNSVGALTKSILMDSVPPSERAKWSALESVNTFGWAGSAVLGGFLVTWQGIEFNFYLTASLQILATIPLMLVLKKVGNLRE